MRKDQALLLGAHQWQARFVSETEMLTCRHKASGACIQGRLRFEATADNGPEPWCVMPARDGIAGRLGIVNRAKPGPRDTAQALLVFTAHDGVLQIQLVRRAWKPLTGCLTFWGEARLGRDTFACRTTPGAGDAVLQMASGPADSRLNDSLLDIPTDTALRFQAASMALSRVAESARERKPCRFNLELVARTQPTRDAVIRLELRQGYYRSQYVPFYRPLDRRCCPTPPTGWMSWNVYFDQATEDDNLNEARIGARELKPYGLKIWSIESWQENSDRLPVSDFHNLNLRAHPRQFPHGMKWLAREIRRLGFQPGIWTVAFGTGEEAFYNRHRDWFIHGQDGKPISHWTGKYMLDPTHPAARRWMEHMHRVMSRDWGYEFFKVDGVRLMGLYCEQADVQAAFRQPQARPLEKCLDGIARGIGSGKVILACAAHHTGVEAKFCHAARIGSDIVSPNQPSTWHNVVGQAIETLSQLFVHGIVWYSDPDTLLVGPYHSLDVARITATVVALPGQVTFAGDRLAELPRERMRLLQQALPACDVRPLDLFPITGLMPVWDLKISRPFGSWDVVSLFNWHQQPRRLGFAFAALGLPSEGEYLLYDFWQQEFLGSFSGGFSAKVPPRSNRLLAIHRSLGRPQYLSTDRHITQGGVGLEDMHWDDSTGALSGSFATVPGRPVTLVFYIPPGYRFDRATAKGATVERIRISSPRLQPAGRSGALRVPRGAAIVEVVLRGRSTSPAHWRVHTSRER
ncbi:MAG: hypothetical protein NTW87_34595 [Planctomycetota bacterium]|nr:hypothetical protein [Planctomycetota bacterium]